MRKSLLLALLSGTPVEAQVVEWTALIDLPPSCAEATRTTFVELSFDGEDLADVPCKLLAKMLAKAGLQEPEAAAKALLLERDSLLTS